jgi:prefoldin subunit 5
MTREELHATLRHMEWLLEQLTAEINRLREKSGDYTKARETHERGSSLP